MHKCTQFKCTSCGYSTNYGCNEQSFRCKTVNLRFETTDKFLIRQPIRFDYCSSY